MPFVAYSGRAATDLVGELLAELARPLSHGFVADDDAAGGQQLLRHAQTQWKAEIQLHCVADHFGRKPIPGVTGATGCRHPTRLLIPTRRCKRYSIKLTVPQHLRSSRSSPALLFRPEFRQRVRRILKGEFGAGFIILFLRRYRLSKKGHVSHVHMSGQRLPLSPAIRK